MACRTVSLFATVVRTLEKIVLMHLNLALKKLLFFFYYYSIFRAFLKNKFYFLYVLFYEKNVFLLNGYLLFFRVYLFIIGVGINDLFFKNSSTAYLQW